MRLQYIQHVEFENPAVILEWCDDQSHEMTGLKPFAGDRIDCAGDYDGLVVMGGPMSVHDTDIYPWMIEEKKYIEKCAKSGMKILGVCLGAQLLAEIHGAEVSKNEFREIGWHDIRKISGSAFLKDFPSVLNVFHWHGETFSIPRSAERIFESEACGNQGFICGNCAGFQFHIESNCDSINALVSNCREDLDGSRYVQSAEEISERIHSVSHMKPVLYGFMNSFFRG